MEESILETTLSDLMNALVEGIEKVKQDVTLIELKAREFRAADNSHQMWPADRLRLARELVDLILGEEK